MKVGIVIPWRETPSRIGPFSKVVEWYGINFPEATIYLADHDYPVFNLAASRNLGVRNAQSDGCDVVLIGDADTIGQAAPIREALESAVLDNICHTPYTRYHMITDVSTIQFVKGRHKTIGRCRSFLYEDACSGLYIATPETWFAMGGQDEKFVGWGFEDTAWRRAHEVIFGKLPMVHEGDAYAMYHVMQENRNGPLYNKNKAIYERYLKINNKEDMLKLVRSPK
jgi:hypothetical protein